MRYVSLKNFFSYCTTKCLLEKFVENCLEQHSQMIKCIKCGLKSEKRCNIGKPHYFFVRNGLRRDLWSKENFQKTLISAFEVFTIHGSCIISYTQIIYCTIFSLLFKLWVRRKKCKSLNKHKTVHCEVQCTRPVRLKKKSYSRVISHNTESIVYF